MEKLFNFLLKYDKVLTEITHNNSSQYNLIKTAEESNELATILLQKATKDERIPNQGIVDEVGDVFIRLVILTKIYGVDTVISRLEYKLNKFTEYNDSKRYKNI